MSLFIVIAQSLGVGDAAWAHLQQAGVLPASPSRREKLNSQQIHGLMLKTAQQRMSHLGTRTHPASTIPALEKMWTELATDLMLANVDAVHYGWCQELDPHTPAFWLRLDPEVRFVLVYEDPAAYVTRATTKAHSQGEHPDPLESLLSQWHAHHGQLLETFYALGGNAVLAHVAAAADVPGLLSLMAPNHAVPAQRPQTCAASTLLHQLVTPRVADHPQAHALWLELQAAAQCPAEHPADDSAGIFQSVGAVLDLQAELKKVKRQLDTLREENARLESSLTAEAALRKQEAADKEQAQTHSKQKAAEQARMTEQQSKALREAQEEGELLLNQLHQVQEELENYFLKYQEQKAKLQNATDFWQQQPQAEVWADMRYTPNGGGWYEAEADGRWSGPGNEAFIDLPLLTPGSYLLELHIADAMDPDLVASMQLTAQFEDGTHTPVDLVHEFGAAPNLYPMVSTGLLQLPACGGSWQLHMALPRVVCPADQGGSDTRSLGLRLQGVRLSLQANSAEGPTP